MVCEKVSLHKPCLNALEEHQLTGLEKMLAAQLLRAQGNIAAASASVASGAAAAAAAAAAASAEDATGNKGAGAGIVSTSSNTAATDTFAEDVAGAADVWLRKRLVESVGSVMPSKEEQEAQLQEALASMGVSPSEQQQWRWTVQPVPWQRQIGPSCGLAALRMVRDHYMLRAAARQSETRDENEEGEAATGGGGGGGGGGSGGSGVEGGATPAAPAPLVTKRRAAFTGAKWGMSARLVGRGRCKK